MICGHITATGCHRLRADKSVVAATIFPLHAALPELVRAIADCQAEADALKKVIGPCPKTP